MDVFNIYWIALWYYPMSLCFCISFSFLFLLPNIPKLRALVLEHTNPLRMDPDNRKLEGRNICFSCPLGSLLSSSVFINTLKLRDPQRAEACSILESNVF